jgi:hypothetical protein
MARGGHSPIYAVPAQKIDPQDYIWRSLTCKLKAHFTKQSPYEVLKEEYGDDEPTKAVMNVITKAATVPADTVTSGWASQLVETSIQDYFGALMPNAVYQTWRQKVEVFVRPLALSACRPGDHADHRGSSAHGCADSWAAGCVLGHHLHLKKMGSSQLSLGNL